jgi:hypothetical protein
VSGEGASWSNLQLVTRRGRAERGRQKSSAETTTREATTPAHYPKKHGSRHPQPRGAHVPHRQTHVSWGLQEACIYSCSYSKHARGSETGGKEHLLGVGSRRIHRQVLQHQPKARRVSAGPCCPVHRLCETLDGLGLPPPRTIGHMKYLPPRVRRWGGRTSACGRAVARYERAATDSHPICPLFWRQRIICGSTRSRRAASHAEQEGATLSFQV